MERVCENCAGEDDDLATVRRVLTPPGDDAGPAAARPQADVELWCFSCRTQYPNEPADEA